MADKLLVTGLAADCRVGLTETERAAPQRISIDLELEIDAAKAAQQDDVQATVDYARLVERVKQLVEGTSYRLLETMAQDVAAEILDEFGVPQALVRVTKRALPGIDSASVEVTRRKITHSLGTSRRSGRFPTAGPR
jgi:dihydroneopterin aldolase